MRSSKHVLIVQTFADCDGQRWFDCWKSGSKSSHETLEPDERARRRGCQAHPFPVKSGSHG